MGPTWRFFAIVVAAATAVAIGITVPAMPALAKGGSVATMESGQSAANDAGSGGDAGDTTLNALPLSNAQRTWSANLTPSGTDADWYRLPAAGAFCSVGTVTTQSPGAVTLTGDATRAASASRASSPHLATRLALAAPEGATPFLGVESPSLMAARGEESGANGPPTPTRYTFAFSSRSHAQLDPEGDGESPEAGATPANAAALPADCSAGRLSSAAGDLVDTYAFGVTSTRLVTISFVVAQGDAAEARVVSPAGVTMVTLSSGAVVDVWADQAGTWTLVVEPPSGAAAVRAMSAARLAAPVTLGASAGAVHETMYMLGVTDGPGDTEPCRPSCLG